ncbi:11491_t:CDS:2 [Gigaspora rosea]|nr:11491_t:CDS:2 [Gigaspora rosea]
MLTQQQIKRIHRLETKGKTPIWFKKLEETILEDQISRRIKGVYAQQEEINESQIKPKKKKNIIQKIKERMDSQNEKKQIRRRESMDKEKTKEDRSQQSALNTSKI